MTLAIVPAPALGDGILGMVLAWNAHRAGRDVVVLHDALTELAPWYPWARIESAGDGVVARLEAADAAFLGDPARHADAARVNGSTLCFGKQHWLRDRPYLESLRAACTDVFDLTGWDDSPGTVPPTPRTKPTPDGPRVALHPTSASPAKDWGPERWLALARLMQERNWKPLFLVAPADEARWQALVGSLCPVVVPGRLDAVATWLQDRFGCIATDSGIAHLASAVGVPTLAVFRKRSASTFWRPAWGRAGAVAPGVTLPPPLRRRLWPRLLTPARVLEVFDAVALRA